MIFTFGEAKTKLARFAGAYGLVNLSQTLNEAMDELASTRSWQNLRKIIRFDVSSEFFALPQDCARLTRCAIEGVPSRIVGQDYEFLSSGPGDLDYFENGSLGVIAVKRDGVYPTMNPMTADGRLAAFSATAPTGKIRAKVRLPDGDTAEITIPCRTGVYTSFNAASVDSDEVTAPVSEVLAITLPTDAEEYVSLYSTDGTAFTFISRMHPKLRVPEFVRYRLPGFVAGETYRVLAEYGVRFIPLAGDDDVVPFSTVRPLQYMLQAFHAMDSNEPASAETYRKTAEMYLLRREEVDNEKQGLVVLNNLYTGSLGEDSAKWENV